jgi:hypothetical protein
VATATTTAKPPDGGARLRTGSDAATTLNSTAVRRGTCVYARDSLRNEGVRGSSPLSSTQVTALLVAPARPGRSPESAHRQQALYARALTATS